MYNVLPPCNLATERDVEAAGGADLRRGSEASSLSFLNRGHKL